MGHHLRQKILNKSGPSIFLTNGPYDSEVTRNHLDQLMYIFHIRLEVLPFQIMNFIFLNVSN